MTSPDQDTSIRNWFSGKSETSASDVARNRREKIARLSELAVLRFSGRIDEMALNLTDDCEMFMSGGPHLRPFSGRSVGRAEVAERMRLNHHLFEFMDMTTIAVIVEGEEVAIRWMCQAHLRKGVGSQWVEGMTVVRFRDNLVSFYGNYYDTAALWQMVELKPDAAKQAEG